MKWLGVWGITRKLLAMGVLGIVLVAVPTVFYLRHALHQIDIAQQEQRAIDPSKALLRVMQLTQQHRALSAGILSGNTAFVAAREKKAEEVNQALTAMAAYVQNNADDASGTELWNNGTKNWQAILSGMASKSLSPQQSYDQHTALIGQYLTLLDHIADYYGISMDAEPDGSHLMMAAIVHLPLLTEALGQLQARGTQVLTLRMATGDENFEFTKLLGLTRMHSANMTRAFEKAMAENSELKQQLEATAQDSIKQAAAAVHLADRQIAQTDNLVYSPADYFKAFSATIESQLRLNEAAMAQLGTLLDDRVVAQRNRAAMILGIIAAIITVTAVFGFLIGRSITRPLREAVAVAQKVAAGDLTSTVHVTTRDEMGNLLQALNDMMQSLKNIAGAVKIGSDAIAAASSEIASGNADLSQRTEEEASSLEETASSMEELTSTVKQNADNAKQANQLAAGASNVAVKGGKVVGEVVGTMTAINESSKKIVDIIGVIDGIAFQTNILALNAAVEAARAGEQGRGFAVVASEVRTLAQRSAAAAREIKELITDSVHKVDDGTRLVGEAGKTMDEIVAAVKRVTDIMSEIAAASDEQTSGIEQINVAITQMDQATQQNAALVEQAAAAAESMELHAQKLAEAVSVFKLGDAQQPIASEPSEIETPASTATPVEPRLRRTIPHGADEVQHEGSNVRKLTKVKEAVA